MHVGLTGAVGPIRGGLLVAMNPDDVELSHAAGSLDIVLGCGCYRMGVRVATRAGQLWPDVGVRLTLSTPTSGSCPGLGGHPQ